MRQFLIGLAFSGLVLSANVALAGPPVTCAACGRAAPAPEMGASVVGLAMAGVFCVYTVRRRRKAQI
jgi:hypothetical protein